MPILVVLALVAAGGGLVYFEFFQTYHLAAVTRGVLYRDGSHSIRELRNAVRQVHPKTVVSLNDPIEVADPAKPQFKEEEQYLAEQGVRLVRIPVTLGGWPSSRDVQAFLDAAAQPGNQPVLVHCAQGVRRTGMFVAAYQLSVEHYDKAKAKAAIQSFGHSEKTLDDIRKFIDAYDPQSRTLPELKVEAKAVGGREG